MPSSGLIAVGSAPGLPARAALIDPQDGTERIAVTPADHAGGVRVAAADFTGDRVPELVTATHTPGGPARIQIFDGVSAEVLSAFDAFDSAAGNVHIAAGWIDAATPGVVVGAGVGDDPVVRLFTPRGELAREVTAFAAPFAGGVDVALGYEDGAPQLVAAAGPGGGPHVKVFDGLTLAERASYFAYDAEFAGGVGVATGDLDGDGTTEVVTGPGATGGPHVRVFDAAGAERAGFFAADGGLRDGSDVALMPGDSDGPVVLSDAGTGLTGWTDAGSASRQSQPLAAPGGYGGRAMSMSGPGGGSTPVDPGDPGDPNPGGTEYVRAEYVDNTAHELNEQTARVAIVRDTATTSLTVTFTLTGTASAADYSTPATTTVSLNVGELSKQVVITPVDDDLFEGDEDLTLTIQPGTGYYPALGQESQTVNIIDDDTSGLPEVWVEATDADAAEAGPDGGTFLVRRDDTAGPLTVPFVLSGEADPGDYAASPHSAVSFAAGDATAAVGVTPIDDAEIEGAESVVLTLAAGTGYDIRPGSGSAAVSIADDDYPDPAVVDDDFTVREDELYWAYWLLFNDQDGQEAILTMTAVSDPAHGAAVLNDDQTVTYTPDADYHGDDSFTYTVTDNHGGSATAAVSVTVEPVIDKPTADDLNVTTDEDTPLVVRCSLKAESYPTGMPTPEDATWHVRWKFD